MKLFWIGFAAGIVVAVGIIGIVVAVSIRRIDINKHPLGEHWRED